MVSAQQNAAIERLMADVLAIQHSVVNAVVIRSWKGVPGDGEYARYASDLAADLRTLLTHVNRPIPSAREIAKIINPKAFDPPYDKFDDVHDAVNADRREAMAKAVQILDLIGGAGPQGGA